MKFSLALFTLIPLVAAIPAADVVSGRETEMARAADTQGNVFVCANANFEAPCAVFHGSSGECVPFSSDFNNDISAFGPDSGQDCFIFAEDDCTGSQAGPIRSPGIADLSTIGLNDIISSFQCFFG